MTAERRRAVPAAVTAAVTGTIACALLVSGCGVQPEGSARALDPHAAPYRLVTRDRSAPPVGTHRLVVYFVRDGALVPVARRSAQEPTPATVLKVLSAGPSDAEQNGGLTTGLPLDLDPQVGSTRSGTVTVALPAPSDSSNRSDSVLAFGQLVLTLTALPSVSAVLFEQGGQPLQVPRSDGSLSDAPLTRVDYRDLIDPT